jgi:hypothetical protein
VKVNVENFRHIHKKKLFPESISALLGMLHSPTHLNAEMSFTLSKYGHTPVKIILKPRDIRNIVKYIMRMEIHLCLFSCGVSKPSDSSGILRLKKMQNNIFSKVKRAFSFIVAVTTNFGIQNDINDN